MSTITVATISTGDASLLTLGTAALLQQATKLVLRTQRHPVAKWLTASGIAFETLDTLYEAADDFDLLNQSIAARLIRLAQNGDVVYATSDPLTDAALPVLLTQLPAHMQCTVLPGVSHAQRCLAMLGLPSDGIRICAAQSCTSTRVSPAESLLITELYDRECASDCKLHLAALMPEDLQITFFSGDEGGRLFMKTIPLYELDRQVDYQHWTACHIPPADMLARSRFDMDDLIAVMQRLRAPNGCPWDKEQTHESLLTNLLEECYEFVGAVRDQDSDHMYDELGDVLLQVVFHAEIARQQGDFDINNVTTAITQKMIERHPHIFSTVTADTSEQVLDNWEAIKRSQRGIKSVAEAMDDVSIGLSAAMYADKIQGKAAKVGFDFPDAASALAKVHEEADEVAECLQTRQHLEEELGDLFFSIINVTRLCKINPDIALFAATNKFKERFRRMENSIKKAGNSIGGLTLSEMDVYWEAEKQATPSSEA